MVAVGAGGAGGQGCISDKALWLECTENRNVTHHLFGICWKSECLISCQVLPLFLEGGGDGAMNVCECAHHVCLCQSLCFRFFFLAF